MIGGLCTKQSASMDLFIFKVKQITILLLVVVVVLSAPPFALPSSTLAWLWSREIALLQPRPSRDKREGKPGSACLSGCTWPAALSPPAPSRAQPATRRLRRQDGCCCCCANGNGATFGGVCAAACPSPSPSRST